MSGNISVKQISGSRRCRYYTSDVGQEAVFNNCQGAAEYSDLGGSDTHQTIMLNRHERPHVQLNQPDGYWDKKSHQSYHPEFSCF